MTVIKVTKLPVLNTLVIKQVGGQEFFISTSEGFIITIDHFAYLLKYLVDNSLVSPKVLEGILEDYYCGKN